MLAHIRKSDGAAQSLEAHCRAVSLLCARGGLPLGLEKTAKLLGLLHDMGKATETFKTYLLSAGEEKQTDSHHYHAPTGAIFVFRRWFREDESTTRRLTAQILALCIYGHHGGFLDCLDEKGQSQFLDRMNQNTSDLHYEEAEDWFCTHIATEWELDILFEEACTEVSAFCNTFSNDKVKGSFYKGMLARLLLSILVDADRWDAACFDREGDSLQETAAPDWNTLLDTFETFRRENLSGESYINKIRGNISKTCYDKATMTPGIFTLCVPTGGGKTYSSLRFALRHAALYGKQRIFYIIPYNTILDQNARDIRTALSDYSSILEHHSNVVVEPEEEKEQEKAQEEYKILTERWDSHIILTSLVQFLDACFSATNTDARRLYRLSQSVLIFDEIQSLPKRCKVLFEWVIQLLAEYCGCTVVLCTATQPKLNLEVKPTELMENTEDLFRSLWRVEYLPQLKPEMDNGEAAGRLSAMAQENSVLAVVNTKAVAQDIFEKTIAILRESGMEIVEAEMEGEEEVVPQARGSERNQILCIHLSTLLCSAHRLSLIRQMKTWLKEGKRVLCVSTALIEAGINISFPVVMRSLTGLPSIVQAAGRANRNMEYDKGQVEIWKLYEEDLKKQLEDIQNGQNCSSTIMEFVDAEDLDMPETIALYFRKEADYIKDVEAYPMKKSKGTLTDLLSKNNESLKAANLYLGAGKKLVLKQAFRTAQREFRVIPDNTTSILVPFGEGRALIRKLNGQITMQEEISLLRKAQAYSVGVYENMFKALQKEGALYPVGNTGVLALEEGYYDEQLGLRKERGELRFNII